jgi:hypothetical protein
MKYLLFITALALSACAAYYSIMGLVAIFAAAVIPILIMGSLLEASKLVVASWLYRTWKEIPVLMKTYFTFALVVLMLLTSMGIFGYLSKAHLDQAIPTGDVQAKLALIDEKIKTEKENINANRKELSQLDSQVDQTIARTTDSAGADRAISIRRNQQKDRARILSEIGTSQTKIAKLNEERAPIASEVRKVEAEVGPIKYIAALLYGDNPETDLLEKAVRWVIIMIVIVFDPLAVLMLVAANWQMRKDDELKPSLTIMTDSEGNQQIESIILKDNDELEEPNKPKWSDMFFKKSPLPVESKKIIEDFFGKKKPEELEPEQMAEMNKEVDVVIPETTPQVEEYGTFGQREKRITLESNVEAVDNISIELPQEKPPRMPLR